jgi:hypothetical protein
MDRSRLGALALFTLAAVAAAAGGCGGGQSPSAPTLPNVISIRTLAPPAGTRLTPGASVTFTATLDYMLNNAGSAEISLVIDDQSYNVLNVGNQPTTVVSAGQGSAILTGTFRVPAAGVSQLQLLFTLTPNTSVPVPTVAPASYPVGG